MTAFASVIGELCRPCFLRTIPLPTGPGLPSVNISISLTISITVSTSIIV